MKLCRSERGITLLELMIAILVLSIGTLAVMRTLDQSRREIGGEMQRHLAQSVAANRAAEIRIYGLARGVSLPDRVRQGPYEWNIETKRKQTEAGLYAVTLLVSTPDGPGARLVLYAQLEPPQ
jgi:general secretion pathway protein I